jgi:hypothetical protein
MNEPNAGEVPVESTPLPTPYKDRSVGLIVFGILTIMLGCLAGLLVPLMMVPLASGGATHAPASVWTIVPVVSLYGILAVALVWLGIGSIKARRWARALLLIFSWGWLIMGVLALVFMAFFMPHILANMPSSGTTGQPALASTAIGMMMVFMFLIMGVFFVILPVIWTFFYSSRDVKTTCEMRDPVRRWTDACPLPVLGFCLWLMVSVPMMLIMPVAGHGVMPFFGIFLTGLPGTMLCLAIAAIWSYAAWSLYKLEPRGWWLILIAMCVVMASALVTFARHDIMEMYRLMGYPEAQIEQMQKVSLLTGNGMGWMTSCFMVPFLGYLLFIKKYLRRQP